MGAKCYKIQFQNLDKTVFTRFVINLQIWINIDTGKSFSEALILASTNPQFDKRLFIEVQHMKIASSKHGENNLGWFKNPLSSQTEKLMAATKFSDYLGLNHYKKAKKK